MSSSSFLVFLASFFFFLCKAPSFGSLPASAYVSLPRNSIFVDLFRKNALYTKVWFECTWVAVFWVLELGGYPRRPTMMQRVDPLFQLALPPSQPSFLQSSASLIVRFVPVYAITTLLMDVGSRCYCGKCLHLDSGSFGIYLANHRPSYAIPHRDHD